MRRRLLLLFLPVLLTGCDSNNRPPSPAPSPGDGAGQTITGRERIGWDQTASDSAELATFRYAIYVDNARSVIADVTCATAAGATGFACSGRLPSMTPGAHVLEIAAFVESDGVVESARSAPLRVTVSAATTPVGETPLASGEVITTRDGVQLRSELLLDGLRDVTDMALDARGALLVAERSGSIVMATPTPQDPFAQQSRAATGGSVLALAPAPDFARTGHLYVIHDVDGVFRLTRYRLFETQLVERLHLIPDVAAAADPSAALRFGPEGKLYAAFDSGGDPDAAARMSDWRGKVLRLNADGRTPDDQPAGSPVYWHGLASPRAIGWSGEGVLWIAERGHDGIERLRALASGDNRPRRAGQRASYVLPGDVDASSLVFHDGRGVSRFAGNMFVAARGGGYLLRVQFDDTDRSKAMTTEKLLEGRLGGLRAVTIDADGALYLATRSAVWGLRPIRNQP